MAPQKRKRDRDSRNSIDVGENRPSPHRPASTNLGQYQGQHDSRDGVNRRPSRGGNQGGGRGARRSNDRNIDINNPNNMAVSGRGTPTQNNMSPPPPRPTSANLIATPTSELSPLSPKRDPAPYDYSFITDERKAAWNSSGRQEVIVAAVQARLDEDTMDLASVLQEFIRATLDGRLDPVDAGNCVKEILGSDDAVEGGTQFDAQLFFVDIFAMICESETSLVDPSLRTFIIASGVSLLLMRQKLDGQTLIGLGLTSSTFIRQGIRQTTNLLYRQSNYNLLREESEGYSKLCTELYTTCSTEPANSENVEAAFERVRALIGTFDLDVGRVLDITLDIFASVLIRNFRFLIKMLRSSSWWPRNPDLNGAFPNRPELLPAWALPGSSDVPPSDEDTARVLELRKKRDVLFWTRAREVGLDAYFELGGRDVVDEEAKRRIFGDKEIVDSELDADRQWINATGTLPPPGNRVAAQLLGFKLRFYHSDARAKEDELPQNLFYLTALLIKIGFISLRDLYGHLSPSDEAMEKLREMKIKEMEEQERSTRPGGASNALMMAGALPDDTIPTTGRSREAATTKTDSTKTTSVEDDKDQLPEPEEQKVQLLSQLLTIGALPESLFILGRFPWIPDVYPAIRDLINRIILHSICDIYAQCSPTASAPAPCPTQNVADFDQSGVPKGQVRLSQIQTRRLLKWPHPDKIDHEGASYRFYWDEWADNVPVCQTVDDLFTLCGTFLNYSGVRIGTNVELLTQIARIGNVSLAQDTSSHNLTRWQDLLKRILVPALSFTKSNTSIVNEIWEMLQHYPVSVRYSIYAEWFEGQTSRLPAMKAVFARTSMETQAIMKRISMTNITTMARKLSKAAFSSPGIVFRVALGQIEEYSNLTEVVIECAKYFTYLGYDVLLWSLMSSLGGKDRNRSSSEFALLPSQWLLALSRFAGKVFKRYKVMNPSPIIQFVNNQLHLGNSKDLVILKELIGQMSGIVPNTDFTDAQLAGMTGWDNLRRITLISLQDKRYESVNTSKRFIRALTDTKLAGELLISIAQYRQAAIYSIPDDEANIKVLSSMIDDTQTIFLQYLDLLRSNFSVEEFDKHVPGIPDLLTDFGLQPALAFMIGRSSVLSMITQVTSPAPNGTTNNVPSLVAPASKEIDAEGDITMNGDDKVKKAEETIAMEITNGDTPEAQSIVKERSPSIPGDTVSAPVDKFQQCLEPIMSTLEGLFSEDAWASLTPEFYTTFWVTTLSEIAVPQKSYEAGFQRLLAQESELSKSDRTDTSRQGVARRAEAKKAATESKITLQREWNQHLEYASKLKLRLSKRKHFWFRQAAKADTLSDEILEKCIFPRLLLSPTDADFVFSMIKFMHETNTPHFRTLSLYARLFRAHRLRSIIFTCTVREAENLGRFLRSVLLDLARWHASSSKYEKEALGSSKQTLNGFAKSLDSEGKPKGFLEHDGKNGFRNVLLTWHRNLNSALRDCLEGKEWMHIRNAVTVLKSVLEVFPAVDFMGNGFIKQLETITKREKGVREDLALTGNALLVGLKKRSRSWVMVQAFGFSMVPPVKTNGSAPNATTASVNPSARTALKPTAPEFKPNATSSQSTPKPHTTEVEDGEVDDAKTSNTVKTSETVPAVVEDKKPEATAPVPEPQISEVLLKRQQHKRDQELAKSAVSTPQSAQPILPPRSDPARSHPVAAPGDRNNNHLLPSRPDAPFPPHHDIRNPRHGDRRDIRDPRLPDLNRSGRPGDRPADRMGDVSRAGPGDRSSDRVDNRPREFPNNDRRSLDSNTKDFGRPSDRNPGPDRARDPPPRWVPGSARDNQDRFRNGGPSHDSSGRLSRETAMPPPRSLPPVSDRAPPVALDRPPPINPERVELINPERQALISGGDGLPRSESPRRGREDLKDRNSSRPQSPRRHALEKEMADGRHDDRPSRDDRSNRHADEHPHSSRSRADDSHAPPAGPRSDRQIDRSVERGLIDRMPFQPMPVPPRQPVPDPNFGRLNPVSVVSDIPSGPRDRNSRGNRPPLPPAVPPPRRDVRPEMQRPPTPDKQPPTGPAQSRQTRRPGPIDVNSIPVSTPISSNSATTSPATGVHPDRLKHLPVQAVTPAPPPPPPPAASLPVAAGMHPDRRMAYGNDGSMNHQVNNRSRQPMPPSITTGPPSGPKGNQGSPLGAMASSMSAPTGPASSNERAPRGGPRRQLAGINTALQQGGSNSINVRGRGGRSSTGGMANSPSQNQSHFAIPPPPPGPPQHFPQTEPVREVKDLINPARADLITSIPLNNDDRDRDRSSRRSDHSGRRSRKSSRSPGRERDSKRPKLDEERAPRDQKDRRGSERIEPDRERNSSRNSPHPDLIPGREPRIPGRDGNRNRERERSDRDPDRSRDGREREPREQQRENWNASEHRPERGERGPERGGGGRSRDMGRGGDPRNEERRDSRGNRGEEAGGRKRHSEDAAGIMDTRGREKRTRRG